MYSYVWQIYIDEISIPM